MSSLPNTPDSNSPLWVLDTNVVLDLLHFDDPATRPLLQALRARQVRCAVSAETFGEWLRVLAYPEFGLDGERRDALAAAYRNLALPPVSVMTAGDLPRCSDPDDQKFLELAVTAGAQALVSKDRALLRLRRRCAPRFAILTPAEAGRWLSTLPG